MPPEVLVLSVKPFYRTAGYVTGSAKIGGVDLASRGNGVLPL